MKNDYYVYLHKTLDGEIFYVGKGRKQRAYSKHCRSSLWQAIAKNGYTVELHTENLLEKDALEIEATLIKSISNLVNYFVVEGKNKLNLAEYFAVDTNSPSGLIRIKPTWTGKRNTGTLGNCGFIKIRDDKLLGWQVKFMNKTLQVHRIVWELEKGEIPRGLFVDHIDGNPRNNLIENLRLVTAAENNKNKKKYKNNTTGIPGAILCETGLQYYWYENEIRKSKFFSFSNFGKEEVFNVVSVFRQNKIASLNSQGAGYTERHGT